MKRFAAVIVFALFLLATFLIIQQSGSIAQAQDLSNESGSEEVALKGDLRTNIVSYSGEGSGWTIHVRPGIRFGTNDRVIGYLDFLVPVYFTDKSLLFVNPKVSWDDREGYEFNVGAGYRQMILDEKLILGGNIYYDWRRSSSGKRYHQLGVGLEAMTEFDVTAINARVNGYISLSDEEILKTWREYYFTSTGLGYTTDYTVEEPLSGLDYEVGFRIPGISNYVETWVYGGGYNYFADYSKDVSGFMARLEIIPTSFVRASYEYRHDNVHNSEHYGEVMFEVPFSIDNVIAGKSPFEGIGSRIFSGSRDMKTRMYDMVRRDVDIVVEKIDITSENHPEKLLPGDCHCMGLVYVDNSKNAPGAGSGTLEDPYGDINTALLDPKVPSNCVFVFKGSAPYLESVTMMDDLHLWGQGYDRFNMGLCGCPVVRGNVPLDPTHPKDRHSLEMGDNTCVMGFQLENALNDTNNFIVRIQDTSGVKLFGNRIVNNGMGVVIRNSNNVSIVGNSIVLRNNGLFSNVYGVVITGGPTATSTSLVISDNTINTSINGNPNNWMDTGGIMVFSGVVNRLSIENNTIRIRNTETAATSGHGCYGISFEITNGLARNVSVTGNTVHLYGGRGNTLLDFAEVNNFNVSNNSFTIAGGGIDSTIGDYGIVIVGPTTNLKIHDNSFSIKSGEGSGYGLSYDDWESLGWGFPALGQENIELYNNRFSFSGSSPNYGLDFRDPSSANTAVFNAKIYGNRFSGVMDTAFYFDTSINPVSGSIFDLGGGALGSPGDNSVSGYTTYAVDNQWGTTINAQNNWWGTDTPTGLMFNGPVNYTPFLTTEP